MSYSQLTTSKSIRQDSHREFSLRMRREGARSRVGGNWCGLTREAGKSLGKKSQLKDDSMPIHWNERHTGHKSSEKKGGKGKG